MAALVGCGSAKDSPAKKDDAAAVAVTPRDAAPADAEVDAGPPRKVFLHGAGRCGECHEKMYDEWERSAHARSASSPLYKAAAAVAKDPACERCHTPLLADAPKDPVASEGVTCDVCHALRDPKPATTGAGFHLAIDDMVKYGPRCDLKDHDFHRMGCSPEHKEAELCGSCHWWEPAGLPVYTEYKDWLDGPAARAGEPCQSCHMPKTRAALAVGEKVRNGVPDHGLLGAVGDLRKTALALEIAVSDAPGGLSVTITLANDGAGHHVPAGSPERRIVITTRLLDDTGKVLAKRTKALGRYLGDAAGNEVPFFEATRVLADTRIPPNGKQTWTESFPSLATAGTVEIEVEHLAASAAMAKALSVTDIERHPMVSGTVPLGALDAGVHANLPKTVRVAASKAGLKRPKKGAK